MNPDQPKPDMDAALAEQMARLQSIAPAAPEVLAARRAEDDGGAFRKLLAESGLPALTVSRVLGDQVRTDGPFASWGAARDRVRERLAEPPALLVMGGASESGKTLMAVAEAVEFLKKGRRARYTRLFDLMEIYDAARSHPHGAELEFGTEREVSLWLLQPQLLVLDECDKVRDTRYVLDKVFNVAEARREAKRSTVFVGNWGAADFASWAGMGGQVAHGPALVSRVNRTGGFVEWRA